MRSIYLTLILILLSPASLGKAGDLVLSLPRYSTLNIIDNPLEIAPNTTYTFVGQMLIANPNDSAPEGIVGAFLECYLLHLAVADRRILETNIPLTSQKAVYTRDPARDIYAPWTQEKYNLVFGKSDLYKLFNVLKPRKFPVKTKVLGIPLLTPDGNRFSLECGVVGRYVGDVKMPFLIPAFLSDVTINYLRGILDVEQAPPVFIGLRSDDSP